MQKTLLTLSALALMATTTPALAKAKKCKDFPTQQAAQKHYEKLKKSGQTGWKSLDRDGDGKVTSAAIHHRPLPMVLRFSAELRDRLSGVLSAEHFVAP